ncbi:hypothetical protein GCM10010324_22310 [Streptomyces hiroshimensis]|uniref:Uncharacterized protein n=1 Tax=Streptomyces hiroshimensis TaxID=66424 RepID=A0ABQ2YAF0_9ACTN|nr:hypothetical protein GCM10010324_22310 [Streptomyces hiroshimensis]
MAPITYLNCLALLLTVLMEALPFRMRTCAEDALRPTMRRVWGGLSASQASEWQSILGGRNK